MSAAPPRVSVILPVYNGREFLAEAIQALLNQTFNDFELLIMDDGSNDHPEEVVAAFKDPRIHFRRQENRGLAGTLNTLVGLSRGVYIARQDQDDISLPRRLERQVAFLDAHPDTGMVGTWGEIWTGREPTGRLHRFPADNASLKHLLLAQNPFVHTSVMLRREIFSSVGHYRPEKERQPEDFELWSRIMRTHDVANIPEVLVVYREVATSMSRDYISDAKKRWFAGQMALLSAENMAWLMNRPSDDPDLVLLARALHGLHRPADRAERRRIDRTEQQVNAASAARFGTPRRLLVRHFNSDLSHLAWWKSRSLAGSLLRVLGLRKPSSPASP